MNCADGMEDRAVPSLPESVLANWAAAIALWALPYLTLRHHVGHDTTQAMQWSLLAIAVLGSIHVFYVAWRVSRDRAWRAAHGLRTPVPAH